nr:hypothetical protein [Oxalobacteraceae bacterium]
MTQTLNPNPLARYFRKPAIYIRLPSNGEFWPQGSLTLPQNRELPVYPMTAADEITYRTPDALFNGQATVDVIQSCLPSIRNAWDMPALDVYSVLISLRIATYGHSMDLSSTCPACSESREYSLDLRTVLENIGKPDYSQPAIMDEIQIFFRPMTYREQNEISLTQFENSKMVEQIAQVDDADANKLPQMAAIMRKLTDLQMKTVLLSTASIRIPDQVITDRSHIQEYYQNCESKTFSDIRNKLMSFKTLGDPKPVPIKCDSCQHQYDQPIEFDQTNFFARAS